MKIIRVDGSVKKQLENALRNIAGKVGKVGWLNSSAYLNGKLVAEVAHTQEFGDSSKHIPPRPYFRTTVANKKHEWAKIAESGAKAILKGNANSSQVMEGIGLKAAGDVRKTISTLYHPALAKSTILARINRSSKLSKIKGRLSQGSIGGITKPLVDTGFMLGTLTNSVEDE